MPWGWAVYPQVMVLLGLALLTPKITPNARGGVGELLYKSLSPALLFAELGRHAERKLNMSDSVALAERGRRRWRATPKGRMTGDCASVRAEHEALRNCYRLRQVLQE